MAGEAAERSRGTRQGRRFPSDLAAFEAATGDATPWGEWSDAVAALLRRPDAAALPASVLADLSAPIRGNARALLATGPEAK